MLSKKGIPYIDFKYPGIEIKVELLVLRNYLPQIEVGIQEACKSYINKELENHTEEDPLEYQHIYTIAEDEMPRIIRPPFVVTIYALFENAIAQLIEYSREKECKALTLKDINGRSPMSKYNKYMKHVLNYDFQFSTSDMNKIANIARIRNYIAHSNGNLPKQNGDILDSLEKVCKVVKGVSVEGYTLDINSSFLIYAMEVIESILRKLMAYMEERYGFAKA
ncbi:hypothetical protein [Pseudoalteromonas rhizosphaerae]|uniref:RiboL-PSP-HEPN domain-containing protein n=1 Tax=Pseudoalteromonas rhizosphaerae TaxID=2518973 RepID=A0ABW8L2D5_9GAMM